MNDWVLLSGLMFVILYLLTVSIRISALQAQVRSLKAVVNRVADLVDLPEPRINDRLRILVEEGKMVQAVKEAREALGFSLVEAKQYVDGLGRKNR